MLPQRTTGSCLLRFRHPESQASTSHRIILHIPRRYRENKDPRNSSIPPVVQRRKPLSRLPLLHFLSPRVMHQQPHLYHLDSSISFAIPIMQQGRHHISTRISSVLSMSQAGECRLRRHDGETIDKTSYQWRQFGFVNLP